MSLISKIVPGQRWVSEAEPELGVGMMLKVEFKRVEVMFPAANERRQYALDSAPLRRVTLKKGDTLETHNGETLEVEEVKEVDALLVYICGGREIEEAQLSDTMSFSKPEDRLLGGHVDDLVTYDLRVAALEYQCRVQQSPVRGFVGGRVDLIPHQIYIAGEVASRLMPRVLLADEVGLGKTIEACLIMHRLHLAGRADRVLIIVPEPLLHQWFVELLRRFNLLFSLFDEARCASIEGDGSNPFLDSQLVICSVDFLSGSSERSRQAVAAGWDLLIVDEAHHLEWNTVKPSRAYQVVERLAEKTPAVLLLTATPRQLGQEGHFARLRLLDPERYNDIALFQEEAEHYEQVAEAVGKLVDGGLLSAADRELFSSHSERIGDHFSKLENGDETLRQPLVRELLDAFGTGRVMFRNTREALTGFPERKVKWAALDQGSSECELEVKLEWLVRLLKELGESKILLICHSQELAEEIAERLRQLININCGCFHEGMTLIQRDRTAAYFSEPEGARILICSEIGSEGRNFQFAHHLVLFDLPENPELLEQRIGRLDRIGQTQTIQIHVPHYRDSYGEVLARWYHEGLNAFEHSLHGATEILSELGGLPGKDIRGQDLTDFIVKTQLCRDEVLSRLGKGYDRLLELNSSRPELAQRNMEAIAEMDEDRDSELFLLRLWDHFGVKVDELSDRSYLLLPGHLITDAFPALPDDGLNTTFDRNKALSREDTAFMSWDHPMARTALELLLTSESGNASFAVWEGAPKKGVLLECYAVVECVAPPSLHSDRFMPVTPIRVQVNHAGEDCTEGVALSADDLRSGNLHVLLAEEKFRRVILPMMLDKCREIAADKMRPIVENALHLSDTSLQREIDRLIALGEINDHVSEEEIDGLRVQRDALRAAISKSRLRLDAVRVIFCQP